MKFVFLTRARTFVDRVHWPDFYKYYLELIATKNA